MSGVTFSDRQGNRIGTLSAASAVTWLAIVMPTLLVAERTLSTSPGTPWWPAVVLVLLGLASADLPDSFFPLATVGLAVGWWVAATESPSVGSVLVVALTLLGFHVATSHAAVGAPGRDDDLGVVRALALRTAVIAGTTVALTAVAAVATDRVDVPPVVLGLALIAAGALPWVAGRWLRSEAAD